MTGRGHDLRVALPDESLVLDGDAARLTQVFSNLLNNAAKYTDYGGGVVLAAERVPGVNQAIVVVRTPARE